MSPIIRLPYQWIVLLLFVVVICGCSRHYLEFNQRITNDPDFATARTVVIEVQVDDVLYVEHEVFVNSNRTLKKGKLKLDPEFIENILSGSLSFDGMSVIKARKFKRIQSRLSIIRPRLGYVLHIQTVYSAFKKFYKNPVRQI